MTVVALLDSNVLVAALVEDHEHYDPSIGLFRTGAPFAVAAHSFAEAYSTLTRRSERSRYQFSSASAWAALERIRAVVTLYGLTPSQTFDATRQFAAQGGIGARLYDKLIGEVAVVHGISTIVTWNVGHLQSLFPDLVVATPAEFLESA